MRLLLLDTVVVADDLTSTSEAAWRTGIALRDSAAATLHIVHAAPHGAGMIAQSGVRSEFTQAVHDAAARVGAGTDYVVHVLTGTPTDAVAALADQLSASVIITGRRKQSAVAVDRPLGGTAFGIVNRSLVPCLAVVDPLAVPVTHVLVATDCSDAARGALIVGLSWASALRDRSRGAPTLTALHVQTPQASAERERLQRDLDHELGVLKRSAGDWAGVEVDGISVPGEDTAALIAEHASATGAQLVVLGTRGASANSDGLGSVSAAVLGRIRMPVLLVPPAIWRNYAKDMDYF